ncbi:hypothetical protein TARUN_1796 [Trichoderma arundinaceum]|uniref:Uncharacterized protein n=1 Tax=Trichoderma arundinaceum TaxID=490622 RepID=A0A395NX98_TRIAR|nr:hypothetical protein TARUN_1796 [Trichoderma arundinaceum]
MSEEGLISRLRNFLTLGTGPQTPEQRPFHPLADPESIIPMEDLAVRLKLIEEIRKRHEGFLLGYGGAPFHFTTMNFSLLLLVPLDDLLELLENLEYLFCRYNVSSTQLYARIVDSGEGQSVIQLQFHWMSRNGLDPDDKVKPPYDGIIHRMLQSVVAIRDDEVDKLSDEQRGSLCELESGQTFQVLLGSKDAVYMKRALDLKWAVTRLVALSGFDVAQRCLQDDTDIYSDSGMSYESVSEDLEA